MLLSKDEKTTPLTIDFINKLEEMDFIIRHEQDLGKLSQKILDKVLSIFDCDRAWLLFPCDPDAKSWKIPVESCVAEYPGASHVNLEIEMTQEAKDTFQFAMETEGPVEYGPGGLPVQKVSKDFNVKSQLSMAIYPRIGKPWIFGVHQCSYERIWEELEKKLFKHIAYRIESALGNILFNLQLIEANEHLGKGITQRTLELKNEERFRTLYEKAPLAYQSLDKNGILLEVNKAWLSLLGYQSGEVLGTKFANYIHPDSIRTLKENFPVLLTKGEVNDVNFVIQRKDGSTVDVSLNGKVGLDQEGNFIQTHCIMQDITEKKRWEEKLRKSEEKFHTMADSSYDWEIWHAPEGKYLYISPSCERITGYSRDYFLNDYEFILSIVHPDDLEKFRAHRQQHCISNFEKAEITYRIITKAGAIRWIWHQCHAAVGENGEWLGRRTSNRDVTILKEAEEKLQKSETQLKDAQKIAQLGHWELDIETDTLYWSDEIYRIFGIEPQEFKATSEAFLDTVHPEDRNYVNKSYTESADKKTQYDIEHRIVLKNGNVKWVHEICSTEYDENDKAVRSIGIVHDITEIKALRGIIPICAQCHKIRDDEGYWQQVDHYINEHTKAVLSHGMCKQCSDELYGGQDWYEDNKDEIISKKK